MKDAHLNEHHRRTLDSVFYHPTAENIEWHDVVSLLGVLGTVHEKHNGVFDVTLGEQHTTMDRPHGKDASAAGVRQLQAFLRSAGVGPSGPGHADDPSRASAA